MIEKILIANRGEIACRIIKTASSMGIKTVAAFSDADENALHVKLADESVYLGASESSQSYLSINKIIKACKSTNADAVHPGYGFLSENASFCVELEKAGINFIGPPALAIESMGDKVTSKKIAKDAGVPTIPGFIGVVKTVERAIAIADDIGYPVMIKASAGGGGKGMRIACNSVEVREGFKSSQNEAIKSFGDKRVFIERYIEKPRHIEIQIVADKFGNFVHLGERDCSIQRRNQKVVEEAPSPYLDDRLRNEMGKQAIALAKAVDYFSVGTIEFIVDTKQNFYFLEMNTRLQVEHPVTELVYNIDLVKEMINIASNKELSIVQKNIQASGWAVESRIYAEDPLRQFLPSSGRLTVYSAPSELNEQELKVRNDTGVFEGAEIPIFYDPMIAKLCVWATDRNKAVGLMQEALDNFLVEGVSSNIDFLSAVMENKKFKKGDFSTAFISEEFKDGFQYLEVGAKLLNYFGVIAICIDDMNNSRWEMKVSSNLDDTLEYLQKVALIDGKELLFSFTKLSKNEFNFILDKNELVKINWVPGKKILYALIGDVELKVKIRKKLGAYIFKYRGRRVDIKVLDREEALLQKYMINKPQEDGSKFVQSPMPGLLVSLAVSVGDKVSLGQSLCVVEAMKMENVIRSERNSVVKNLRASVGQSLAVGDVIIEFE